MQEHGLGLVVELMARRDRRVAPASCPFAEHAVALLATGFFEPEPALDRERAYGRSDDRDRQAELFSQAFDEASVAGRGATAKAVMNMDQRDR